MRNMTEEDLLLSDKVEEKIKSFQEQDLLDKLNESEQQLKEREDLQNYREEIKKENFNPKFSRRNLKYSKPYRPHCGR